MKYIKPRKKVWSLPSDWHWGPEFLRIGINQYGPKTKWGGRWYQFRNTTECIIRLQKSPTYYQWRVI